MRYNPAELLLSYKPFLIMSQYTTSEYIPESNCFYALAYKIWTNTFIYAILLKYINRRFTMTDHIKQFFINAKNGLINNRYIIYLSFPFLMMDIITRIIGYKVNFFPAYYPVPNIFTILWVVLFISIITSFRSLGAKIAYWGLFVLFFILFLTNNIYYSLTSIFFSFNLLQMSDEGSSYILDTIINTNPIIYLISILVLITAFVVYKISFKNIAINKKIKIKRILITFLVFVVLHILTPFLLGPANSELKWNTFKNPRNIYENFSDSNKSMKVSGLYEYSVRNFYITYLKPAEDISEEDKEFLDNIYDNPENANETNDYTGLFAGKNLIFLQLEGMDDWLLTKEDTPNLYNLMTHSINFTDHYSTYTGGGSTFNSEFAVNTGFTTPLSYIENVYSFNKNTFNYTMAKLFKNIGYTVNAFHMNSSDFYSRGVNYKSWGYDNYFSLIDTKDYENEEYKLDRELILNETFYENMFRTDTHFVDYIITYSPHTPFTTQKEVGKMIAEEKYEGTEIPDLSEEECARLAVGETDYMVGLLIQALKDNDLYDNTVIVAYADHYLYTLEDKTILDKYKHTENNLINHTPFFIWSSDVTPAEIKEVTMQVDILPTVLNLFGTDYYSNYYIGSDALADDYEGYAFFTDYSWYNGNVYVENGEITNNGKMKKKALEDMSQKITDVIRKNDLTLKYDYFKK